MTTILVIQSMHSGLAECQRRQSVAKRRESLGCILWTLGTNYNYLCSEGLVHLLEVHSVSRG